MTVLDVAEQLRNVLQGTQSLDELRASVSHAEAIYRRPSRNRGASLTTSELQHTVDSYADWEIRTSALARSIEDAMRYAKQHGADDPEKSLAALEAVNVVAPLVSLAINRGLLEFRVGYTYWLLDRFAEAISHLRIAEEALEGDMDEGYSRELIAMHYLVDALSHEKKWDETLAAAQRFLQRSSELKNHACEAQALRHIGLVQARLGREPALDNLEKALRAFDQSSEQERRDYSVAHRDCFLDDLANVARKTGQFERALGIFHELVDFHHQNSNQVSEARALSEIGYTYISSGEVERACEYFNRAADLAANAGDTTNAARWRRQALTFSGTDQTATAQREMLDGPIANQAQAYHAATIIECLIKGNLFKDALPLVEQVVHWARDNRDLQLEITHLNNLGICYANTGNLTKAITTLRQGIQLADGSGNISLSLFLRGSLADAYSMARKSKLAYEVLLSATAFGDTLLNKTESMEVRQQIVSGLLPIQEGLASLLSQTGHHEGMVSVTEGVRTRNLKTWMRAANAVSQAPENLTLNHLLQDLRAVEVEFEVREIAGTATASDIQRISETRTALRGRIDAELSAQGFPPVDWSGQPALNIGQNIAINPGNVAIVLFGVSDGVCVAAGCKTESSVEIRGSFIRWTREDRLKVLAPWIRKGGHGKNVLTPEVFGESTKVLRDRLLEPAASLCRTWNVANVLAVPQGELALVPLWDLVELTSACGSLTLSPSIGVFELCSGRRRSYVGPALVVGDVTDTLPYSRIELNSVKTKRNDVTEANTVDDITRSSSSAGLIHVAGHGVYNPKNPYLSGIIVSREGYPDTWSSQYVTSTREFSYDRSANGWPLLTAAACMANMSLGACRLAVLSACESGVPRLHRGGEMTGLPNALILAGARSVIASLWRVHDAPAAVLMHLLYEVLGSTEEFVSAALSLKEARKRLVGISRNEVDDLLGPNHGFEEDYPFQNKYLSDAFHCFGAF